MVNETRQVYANNNDDKNKYSYRKKWKTSFEKCSPHTSCLTSLFLTLSNIVTSFPNDRNCFAPTPSLPLFLLHIWPLAKTFHRAPTSFQCKQFWQYPHFYCTARFFTLSFTQFYIEFLAPTFNEVVKKLFGRVPQHPWSHLSIKFSLVAQRLPY